MAKQEEVEKHVVILVDKSLLINYEDHVAKQDGLVNNEH